MVNMSLMRYSCELIIKISVLRSMIKLNRVLGMSCFFMFSYLMFVYWHLHTIRRRM